MALAIAIAVVALLLIGFLFLTGVEARRGVRVLGSARGSLDAAARRAGASLTSGRVLVGFGHGASGLARYAVHEVVHAVLSGIRALERFLTRTARTIRESNAAHALMSRKKAPSESTAETVE